jgi:hypothetical protein
MTGLFVASAAAIVVQGCVAVQVVPLPAGDTKAPLTVSASGRHASPLHSR